MGYSLDVLKGFLLLFYSKLPFIKVFSLLISTSISKLFQIFRLGGYVILCRFMYFLNFKTEMGHGA